jgi:hypothetical protein
MGSDHKKPGHVDLGTAHLCHCQEEGTHSWRVTNRPARFLQLLIGITNPEALTSGLLDKVGDLQLSTSQKKDPTQINTGSRGQLCSLPPSK